MEHSASGPLNADNLRQRWYQAICALTRTPEDSIRWLNERYEFTFRVASELTAPLNNRTEGAIIYAVWLEGDHEAPMYIGQSLDPLRRLWDLPIGESHHLANSFPPETWRVIVVVDWLRLLASQPDLASAISSELTATGHPPESVPSAIGLGLEYWLQLHWSPLFNVRTKARDGSWRSVNLSASLGLGARSVRAASVRRLAVAVHDILERLRDAHESSVAKWQPRDAAWCVYPSRIYQWCLRQ